MPKAKPPRSRRRRTRRPPPAPSGVAQRARPPVAQASFEELPAQETAVEPSVRRSSARDYTFVRREVQRIALLAAAIIVTIVILSFFLP